MGGGEGKSNRGRQISTPVRFVEVVMLDSYESSQHNCACDLSTVEVAHLGYRLREYML